MLQDQEVGAKADGGDEARWLPRLARPRVKISAGASQSLDQIRWLAAAVVMVTHLRSLMFVDFADSTNKHGAVRAFYALTGSGHLAVMVFFVLSGYLVGGRFMERHLSGTVALPSYFIDRLTRLHIVLVPALMLTGLLDHLGLHFFNDFGVYDHTAVPEIPGLRYSVLDRLTLAHLLSNFAMMQTTLTKAYGSNGSLWSLANEFWYYAGLPALALALDARRSTQTRLVALAAALLMGFGLRSGLVLYGLIWALGIGVACVRVRPLRRLWPAVLQFALCAVAARSMDRPVQSLPWARFLVDFAFALSFCVLLVVIIHRAEDAWGKRWWGGKVHVKLANVSYSVYAFHAPALTFLLAVLHQRWGAAMHLQPELLSFVKYGAVFLGTSVVLYVLGGQIEGRTDQVRSTVKRLIGTAPAPKREPAEGLG